MKNKRICAKGHTYFKTSDCPVCPVCEQGRKPANGFLEQLSAPARRALESKGITTVQQLAEFSKKEILALHGMGPASVPKLTSALQTAGLDFKK
ncbi:MAG: RNA polymerase alpha subunit C-terminal domain-containing protein [Ferruginibacter sp.]|nr:RNA polymerase alpha subunit C-terminal domain-containing protein [Ferruginibacter sp.]